jgi:ribosomal-protein-alanine N-acetyltransferase
VAEESSEIVGFLIAGRERQKSSHIITVDVVEEWRRRGVGATLMNAAEEWARQQGAESIYLETAEDNFAAQQFYQARGYSQIERVEGYYSNGSAAWVMAKRLGRPSATSRQRRRKAGLTS